MTHYRPYPTERAMDPPTAPPADDWTAARFERPGRPPDPLSDVVTPALQTLTTGAFAGACAYAIWGGSWTHALAGFLGASGMTWLYLLHDHRRLLRTVEEWTRGDPPEAPPTHPPAETLRVEVRERRPEGGTVWTLADLPISRATLRAHALAVWDGVAHWSRRDLAARDSNIGDDRARQIMAALEDHGFLAYPDGNRNHPEGAQLTAKGRALVRGLTGRSEHE